MDLLELVLSLLVSMSMQNKRRKENLTLYLDNAKIHKGKNVIINNKIFF